MPRAAVDDNRRMNLRLRPEQKAALLRAAALRHTDLTDFVLQPALREAQVVIDESERIALSERDSLLVLDLLEHPPAPNARLRAAIAAMPKAPRAAIAAMPKASLAHKARKRRADQARKTRAVKTRAGKTRRR